MLEIDALVCAYPGKNQAVLKTQSITLERGEVVFLLGQSGSGKSTLLEVLGLMSNTIQSGSVRYTDQDGKKFDYKYLWQNNENEVLTELRSDHFSFIFQQNNLMPSFTALENISLPGLIHQYDNISEVKERAETIVKALDLPGSIITDSRSTESLSGGQRQRLAFARALLKDFDVLFADEPTGNLDEKNSRQLIRTLKDNLRDGMAIIVSHDIDLAVDFADRIFVLKPSADRKHAIIDESCDFRPERYGASELRKEIRDLLFNTEIEHSQESNTSKIQTLWNAGFGQLFHKRERANFLGSYVANFWILSMILFLAFLATGFSNTVNEFLKEKLDDPYINWLSIEIPGGMQDDMVRNIVQVLNEDSVKDRFSFEGSNTFSFTNVEFVGPDGSSVFYQGRSFEDGDLDQKLVNKILEKENVIQAASDISTNDGKLGLIVTSDLYTKLAPEGGQFLKLADIDAEGGRIHMDFPIRAIVKAIPGNVDIIAPYEFYNAYFKSNAGLVDLSYRRYLEYYGSDGDLVEAVGKVLAELGISNADVSVKEEHEALETYYVYTVASESNSDSLDDLVGSKMADLDLKRYYDLYDYSPSRRRIIPQHRISVYFSSLEKVAAFKTFFQRTFNKQQGEDVYDRRIKHRGDNLFRIDDRKIKDKNNFYFMFKVSNAVTWLLAIFALVSTVLYVINLIQMHFSKIGSSVGTLKAFGLSGKRAIMNYSFIVLLVLVSSMAFALILSYPIGRAVSLSFINSVHLDSSSLIAFELFNPRTLFVAVLLIVCALLSAWILISRFLSKTPGALVFGRKS